MNTEDIPTTLECLSCGLIEKPDIKMGGLICCECHTILVWRMDPAYRLIRDKLMVEREQQD